VADGRFDPAVATQVYEYVQDMPAALGEAFRVLRPGGRLLVLDTDWGSIVWHSGDAERTRRMLAAWDEHLVDPHLPRRLTRLLSDAQFSLARREAIPLLNAGYDPNTLSAGLMDFITEFVPGRHGLTEADAQAWADDRKGWGDDSFSTSTRSLFQGVKRGPTRRRRAQARIRHEERATKRVDERPATLNISALPTG